MTLDCNRKSSSEVDICTYCVIMLPKLLQYICVLHTLNIQSFYSLNIAYSFTMLCVFLLQYLSQTVKQELSTFKTRNIYMYSIY